MPEGRDDSGRKARSVWIQLAEPAAVLMASGLAGVVVFAAGGGLGSILAAVGGMALTASLLIRIGAWVALRGFAGIPLPDRSVDPATNPVRIKRGGSIFDQIDGALGELSDRATGAERKLDDQVRWFQSLVDELPGGAAVFDAHHQLLLHSEGGIPGPAWTVEEARATPKSLWRDPELAEFASRFEDNLGRCVRDRASFDVEESLPGATGGNRHYGYHFLPLRDQSGEVARVAVVGHDRSEQVHVDTELSDQRERLKQAEKLEALGRLVGGVAHDFNNLLTVIRGHGEMGLTDVGEGDPLREDFEEIVKAAGRASGLTGQLLAFSRKRETKVESLDLNQSLRDVEKMLTRVIGENVRLVIRHDDDLPPVRADLVHIEQIALNLAVNARDAMPHGGTLGITTTYVCADGAADEVWPGAALREAALITVSDSGVGMDDETLARVFEPFFTTKSAGKGTGLGLATVRDIVHQTGGFIEVESTPGEGTTFRIYLPIADPGDTASVGDGAEEPTAGRGETVLVVEDEPDVLALVSKILKRFGYRPVAADTPERALEIVQESGADIDLVLSDVVMPGLDGYQLSGILKDLDESLPILLMSGYSHDVLASYEGPERHDDFLPKPFSATELVEIVRRILDEAA